MGNETDDTKEGDIGDTNDKKKTLNLIKIIQSIRDKLKAAIYSVACEPDLSCNSDFANDFMRYIAEYTKGRFLPLSSARLLPEVIVGSVKQQINLNELKNNLDAQIIKIKQEYGNDISADKLNKIIMEKWKEAGIKKKEISIGTLYRYERSRENIELLMNGQKIKSLADFKANAKMLKRFKRTDFRHLDKGKKKTKRKELFDDDDLSCYDDDDDGDESFGVMEKKKMKSMKTKMKTLKMECEENESENDDGGMGLFGDDDDDECDRSDSGASQAYYSESCSLDMEDIEHMMMN